MTTPLRVVVDFATVVAWPVVELAVTIDIVVISGVLFVLVPVVVRVAVLLPTLMLMLVSGCLSARCRCLPTYGLSRLFTRVLPEGSAPFHGVVSGCRRHVE